MADDIYIDSISLKIGENVDQWPKLSCSQANQLALEVSDLRLDANREILFQGNGQLRASSDMLFLTGGSSPEKLRILANGNVGIGISAPTEKLEVAGKIKATELEASGTVKASAFQGDGSALTGKVNTTGDTITGLLTIQNTLTVSGNVGIGTTSPSYKLAIAAGDINIDDGRALRQAGRWVVGGNSNVLSIGSSDARDGRDISFDPGFAGALTIKKDTGNVGIGTKNPVSRLSIFSTQPDQSEGMIHLEVTEPFSGGHRLLTIAKRNSANTARLDWTFEISRGSIDTPGLTIFRALRPDGTSPSFVIPLHLAWNGNVGIGTTQPEANLHVIGNLLGAAKGPTGEAFRIAVGRTAPNATNWVQYGSYGLYADVDTSSAQFAFSPYYFTTLVGRTNHWRTTGVTSIYTPSAQGFRVYLHYPENITPTQANQWNWHVHWLAIGN